MNLIGMDSCCQIYLLIVVMGWAHQMKPRDVIQRSRVTLKEYFVLLKFHVEILFI
jgi:hypothetical protein